MCKFTVFFFVLQEYNAHVAHFIAILNNLTSPGVIPENTVSIMKPKTKKIFVAIGAVILIVLLLIWLEVAFLSGDTDVTAQALTFGKSAFLA